MQNRSELDEILAQLQQAQLDLPKVEIPSEEDTFAALNPEDAVDTAFKILKINRERFSHIHSQSLKLGFIDYKYLRAEFDILKSPYDVVEKERLLKRLSEAADSLRGSDYLLNHRDRFSDYSVGLTDLDYRSFYETAQEIRTPGPNQLLTSMIDPTPKQSGVEPGFVAIQAEDVFMYLLKTFPNLTQRRQFILDHNADLKLIYSTLKDKLPKHMVKLTYEVEDGNKLVPTEADLARTSTVKKYNEKSKLVGHIVIKLYQIAKTCTVAEKNIEAILEVLANDIARLFMEVQNQKLYPRTNKSEAFQLLLKAQWLDGAKELGPYAGDGEGTNNYMVVPLSQPREGLYFRSDSTIKNIGAYLPIFEWISDSDTIGKKLQNKLRRATALVGIDFGKAFQSAVNYDPHTFHVKDSSFSNYSVFYDVPRSEMVIGILKLARLAGQPLPTLKSHGPQVVKEVMDLEVGADEQIFDDYILKFKDILKELNDRYGVGAENATNCKKIIKRLNEIKEKAINRRNEMVHKARIYLKYDKEVIDLAENIEKLFAAASGKSSLRSPDGKVLLNHIRLTQAFQCNMSKQDGKYTFVINYHGNNKIIAAIRSIVSRNKPLLDDLAKRKDDEVFISFPENLLATVCEAFSEETIKRDFHPTEYSFQASLDRAISAPKPEPIIVQHKIIIPPVPTLPPPPTPISPETVRRREEEEKRKAELELRRQEIDAQIRYEDKRSKEQLELFERAKQLVSFTGTINWEIKATEVWNRFILTITFTDCEAPLQKIIRDRLAPFFVDNTYIFNGSMSLLELNTALLDIEESYNQLRQHTVTQISKLLNSINESLETYKDILAKAPLIETMISLYSKPRGIANNVREQIALFQERTTDREAIQRFVDSLVERLNYIGSAPQTYQQEIAFVNRLMADCKKVRDLEKHELTYYLDSKVLDENSFTLMSIS